jgi:DNA-binding transcriptional regulator GbsR (MarR family)
LAKLLNECYIETKDLLKERRKRKEKKIKENEQVTIELDEECEKFSQDDLEEKLDKIHSQLIKVCVARKNKNILRFKN